MSFAENAGPHGGTGKTIKKGKNVTGRNCNICGYPIYVNEAIFFPTTTTEAHTRCWKALSSDQGLQMKLFEYNLTWKDAQDGLKEL